MALSIDGKYLTDTEDLNLAGFIQGKVGYSLSDLNILTITTARGADYKLAAKDISERLRDLCWADALILYLSKDSKKEQDGGTSQTESVSGYSKDETKEFAMYIYGKWGESIVTLNEVTDITDLW